MKLYLLRHGEAANLAASDSERPLTERGVRETQQVLERMGDSIGGVGTIYSSPKLRALQTAEIAADLLDGDYTARVTELIKPSGDIAALGRFLEQQGASAVLLATHQPFVGNLLDYLVDQPGLGAGMGTSCLACIDLITFERGCGTLNWLECP